MSEPGALCIGVRRSLGRGPALSRLSVLGPGGLCIAPQRSLCWAVSGRATFSLFGWPPSSDPRATHPVCGAILRAPSSRLRVQPNQRATHPAPALIRVPPIQPCGRPSAPICVPPIRSRKPIRVTRRPQAPTRVPPIRPRKSTAPIRVPPNPMCGLRAPSSDPRATHPARHVPFFQERTIIGNLQQNCSGG